MLQITKKISVALLILMPGIYISASPTTVSAQGISDFVEQAGGNFIDDLLSDIGGIAEEFLEDQSGFVSEAIELLSEILDINIEQGRFRIENLGTILGDLPLDENCSSVLHIVPGICPDGVEGLELPEVVGIEDDGEVRASGGLRSNSQPQQDAFSSNSIVLERDLANLYDQQTSRAFAFDYLGETGEEWLLTNAVENQALLEGSGLIQEDILELATNAQDLTVTQDVMKNMAGMNQLRSQIDINNGILLGRINTSLLNIQQQNASQLMLSANISEAFDETNRARRNEQDIAALESFRNTVFIPGLIDNN